MAVNFYTYRFKEPGPTINLTDAEKVAYPIIEADLAVLDDYPLDNEMLGVEVYIDTRLYNGHNTKINVQFYNDATGENLYGTTATLKDPGPSGYSYWVYYRYRFWIAHFAEEINKPMRVRINLTLTSNTLGAIRKEFFIDVISMAPEARECPDFWTDPVNAVLCWIVSTVESLLGVFAGSIQTLLSSISAFLNDYVPQIVDFFSDLPGNIMDAIGGIIPTLQDWWDDITSVIGKWYDDNLKDTIDGLGDAVSGVGDWIDSRFSDIGDWWESVRDTVGSWLSDQWTNVTDFWNDVTGKIGDWWEDTKADIWEGLQDTVGGIADYIGETVGDLWESIENYVGDVIEATFDSFFKGVQTGVDKEKRKRGR